MNADLANNFGNLAQRSLSMVAKNCGGEVPQPGEFAPADTRILDQAHALLDASRAAFDRQEFSRALEAVWAVLGDTNAYFADQQPWVLRKTDPERMNTVLYVTLEVLRVVAVLAQPVMPAGAGRILTALGQGTADDDGRRLFSALVRRIEPGTVLPAPSPVFPKYEEPAGE